MEGLRKMIDYWRAGRILLKSLPAREREILRKENPFRRKRNRLLVSLRAAGVSFPVLSHVSGLGLTQLYMVTRKRRQNKK